MRKKGKFAFSVGTSFIEWIRNVPRAYSSLVSKPLRSGLIIAKLQESVTSTCAYRHLIETERSDSISDLAVWLNNVNGIISQSPNIKTRSRDVT